MEMEMEMEIEMEMKMEMEMDMEMEIKEASLNEHTIQLLYSLPFYVTKDTSLVIFQYKI